MHVKKVLFLILCPVCFFTARGQQLSIDSLVHELALAKEDTGKVILYRILTALVKNTDPARAIAYGRAGVALGRQLDYEKGVAGCYLNISAAYSDASKPDSALLAVDTAIYWSKRVGEPNRLALAFLNRADFNMQLRNLKQSLRDCDTALHYAEIADNDDRRARILQTIGSVYYYQDDYTQSAEYYERANQLYQKIGNLRMSAIVINNLGNVHKHTGQYALAIGNFKRAITIGDSLNDQVSMSMYYGNLGDVYSETGQYALAEQSASRSLEFALQQKNEMQSGVAYGFLSQIYLKQNKLAQAITAANKSYQIAVKHDDLEWQHTAAGVLADAYSRSGDYEKAYPFLLHTRIISDSLARMKYDEDIAAMQTMLRLDEKNNEIALLNKDRQIQRQQLAQQRLRFAAASGMVLLLLLGIALLVNRYRMRQRMKELQIRNQIAADLHDEVGSSLSSIHMLSSMASGNTRSDAGQRAILEKVSLYTRETMDKMGDIVWMIKPAEKEGAGLRDRMQRFLFEICNSQNIRAVFEGEGLELTRLDMDQRKGIYLAFKEAVINAAKYAGASRIEVIVREQNRQVRLTVQDDGVGFSPSEIQKGNGLDNIRNRARELGGRAEWISEKGKGTRVEFIIPVS